MYSPTAEVLPCVRHTAYMGDAESRLRPKVCLQQWGKLANATLPLSLLHRELVFCGSESSPFSTKTGLISLKQLWNESLDDCPQNLSSVPAAPVALGHRSSLYLLGRERFFTIASLLLTHLTFWKLLGGRCHCAAEDDHPLQH